MSETSQQTVSTAEISEIIAELEQYRARIVSEITETGKKIKMSKKQVNAHLEANPEIAKIDAALAQLKSQQEG